MSRFLREGGIGYGINFPNYNYSMSRELRTPDRKSDNYLQGKSNSPSFLFGSTPPFSPINNFLEVSHDNNNNNNSTCNNNIYQPNYISKKIIYATNTTPSTTMNGMGDFSTSKSTHSPLSTTTSTMHGDNFVDGIKSQDSVSYENNMPRNKEINSLSSKKTKVSKKMKKKSVTNKNIVIKGQWTNDEDSMLKKLVSTHGRKWSFIASHLKRRVGKQCRERWINHLHPNIKKSAKWDEEEDRILVAMHKKFENKWSKIAKNIPGRTGNSTKNHFNATLRKVIHMKINENNVDLKGNRIQLSHLEEYVKTSPKYLERKATTKKSKIRSSSPSTSSTTMSSYPPTEVTNVLLDSSYPNDLSLDEYSTNNNNNNNKAFVANPNPSEFTHMQQLYNNNNNNSFVPNPSPSEFNLMQQQLYTNNNNNNMNNNIDNNINNMTFVPNPNPSEFNLMQQLNNNNNYYYMTIGLNPNPNPSELILMQQPFNNNDNCYIYNDDNLTMQHHNNMMATGMNRDDYHNYSIMDEANDKENSFTCFDDDKYLDELLEGISFDDDIMNNSRSNDRVDYDHRGSDVMMEEVRDYDQGVFDSNGNNKDMDLYEMVFSHISK